MDVVRRGEPKLSHGRLAIARFKNEAGLYQQLVTLV
jgi:hypothetical protein